jgi:hypothetical protein
MTQSELERAVALVTGESRSEIHRRGFSLADPDVVRFDPEPDQLPPQMIDWDDDFCRSMPVPCRRALRT